MDIRAHKLVGVPYVPAHDVGPMLVEPSIVVMHYTASATAESAIRQLTGDDQAFVSAHVVVDRDGSVTQLVPFERQAWHCGESIWRGKPRCNTFSIGIELVNPGYATLTDSFEVQGWECVIARHKSGGPIRSWYAYPQVQIEAAAAIVRAIMISYPTVKEIVGHDDVCVPVGRKTDPGPAMNLVAFRQLALASAPVG